jgi:putative membrane protein
VLAFFAGVLIVALALLSPLHALGEGYLLSAHMVQHLLITMVAPPLLWLGTPGWMLRPLLRIAPLRRAATSLLSPVTAFVLFNLIFAVWHAPAFYELALHFPLLHSLEHMAFLGGALIAWWPVFGPLPELPRLPYGAQVLYLFFQSLPPTVLGAIIALAEIPLYPTYWQAPRVTGLEPLADQQLAGLTMWIPGALGYFLVLSVVFFLWLERRSPAADPPYRNVSPAHARQSRTPSLSSPRQAS